MKTTKGLRWYLRKNTLESRVRRTTTENDPLEWDRLMELALKVTGRDFGNWTPLKAST